MERTSPRPLVLKGLECILQVVPGALDATLEVVPFLATGCSVRLQLVLHDDLLLLGVLNLLAIVDIDLGPHYVGFGHQPIEPRAQLPQSSFNLSYFLSCCFHGNIPSRNNFRIIPLQYSRQACTQPYPMGVAWAPAQRPSSFNQDGALARSFRWSEPSAAAASLRTQTDSVFPPWAQTTYVKA